MISRLWLACSLLLVSSALLAEGPLKAPFNGPVHHAREIPVDFLHLKAELSFDWDKEEVHGLVTHHLKSFRDGFKTLTLDAVRMQILAVKDQQGRPLVFRSTDKNLEFDFHKALAKGEEVEISIEYRCKPRGGVYFIQPMKGYPDRLRQVWTQGESENTRNYLPCFDHPAERLTTELLLTVPEEMKVLSNGRLIANRKNGDGTRTVHWRQEKPHVAYLICFAAGSYEKLEQSFDGIPITSWYYPGDRERAEVSYGQTADMMKFFCEKFGRYPWVKYDQIVVRDFVAGGMENTSATILTDRTFHLRKDEPHTSSRGLVAHELAHQWFGDLVTCRDWSDLWLNESFATFSDALYTEHLLGQPDAQMQRRSQARAYMGEDANRYRRPLSCRTYSKSQNMFDSHTYPKGARILEMLRHTMGDDAFFPAVRAYLNRHRFQSVETYQFRRALEDASGLSLGWFFDQWVHHGGHPEIEVAQRYDSKSKRLTLTVSQTQKVDSLTPLYQLPVEIGIYMSGAEHQTESIRVTKLSESFSFRVDKRPSFVRFDRRSVLLKTLDFPKARSEWLAQLSHDSDTLGRIAAAEKLGEMLEASGDELVRERLVERLGQESFWGVRRAIVQALSGVKGDDVVASFVKVLREKRHPRVREQAARELGKLKSKAALEVLEAAFKEDASDWVRTASLRAIRQIDKKSARSLVGLALEMSSHRERIRNAAIDIMVETKDLSHLPKLIELSSGAHSLDVRRNALRALGQIGRDNEKVYKSLMAQIGDSHPRARRAVVDAIASLGEKKARDLLVASREGEKEESVQKAIDRAIERLDRSSDLSEVDRKIEELRKANRELERRLDDLVESKSAKRVRF